MIARRFDKDANLTGETRSAPDWRASAWLLERRHPERWRREEIVAIDSPTNTKSTTAEILADPVATRLVCELESGSRVYGLTSRSTVAPPLLTSRSARSGSRRYALACWRNAALLRAPLAVSGTRSIDRSAVRMSRPQFGAR